MVLNLLGLGKPDVNAIISGLLGVSDLEKILKVMELIVKFPESEQKSCLDKIHKLTGQPKGVLKDLLMEAKNNKGAAPADWPDITMEYFLSNEFEGGRLLIRAQDGQYWKYNSKYWDVIQKEEIKSTLLNYARETVAASEGSSGGSSTIMRAALDILEGRVYRKSNPLHAQEVPAVINCLFI